jgi:hypothetical protein
VAAGHRIDAGTNGNSASGAATGDPPRDWFKGKLGRARSEITRNQKYGGTA